MSNFGIDIYEKYQNVTDWQALKNYRLQTGDGSYPISFAVVKGTDGGGKAAVPADRYVAGVKSIGLPVGLYHYAQFSPTPEAQADILIGECQRLNALGVKPTLDLEAPFSANSTAVDFAARFLNRMIARGFPAQLYWNNSFDTSMRSAVEARVNDFVKWIARYGAMPQLSPDVHQYSSSGLISGISASGVDLDWAYTDRHLPVQQPQEPSDDDDAGDQEDEDMSSDVVVGTGVADDQPFQQMLVPVNGHRYLRIACGWGATAILGGISLVDDTPGASGANVVTVQQGGIASPDRPGPWDLSVKGGAGFGNYSHVAILVKAPADTKVRAWTNDRA